MQEYLESYGNCAFSMIFLHCGGENLAHIPKCFWLLLHIMNGSRTAYFILLQTLTSQSFMPIATF